VGLAAVVGLVVEQVRQHMADAVALDVRRTRHLHLAVERRGVERIAANFRYNTITNPREIEQPLGPALTHFFNHQTHHRGQAHAILTGFGREGPVLDLLAYQRSTGIGMS